MLEQHSASSVIEHKGETQMSFDPISGDLSAWAQRPFQSSAEMQQALGHKEYRNPANEAFRSAVYAKIEMGGPLGFSTGRTGDTLQADSSTDDSTTRSMMGHSFETTHADTETSMVTSDEAALIEVFGAHAVGPRKA
jgi:hypothetical protein